MLSASSTNRRPLDLLGVVTVKCVTVTVSTTLRAILVFLGKALSTLMCTKRTWDNGNISEIAFINLPVLLSVRLLSQDGFVVHTNNLIWATCDNAKKYSQPLTYFSRKESRVRL